MMKIHSRLFWLSCLLVLIMSCLTFLMVYPLRAAPSYPVAIHVSLRQQVKVGQTARLIANIHTLGNTPVRVTGAGCGFDGPGGFGLDHVDLHPAQGRPDGSFNYQLDLVAQTPGKATITCQAYGVDTSTNTYFLVWAEPVAITIQQ